MIRRTASAIIKIEMRLVDTFSGKTLKNFSANNPIFSTKQRGTFSEEKAKAKAIDITIADLGKILPEKITRRMSIEIINKANGNTADAYKLVRIPGIRARMGELEHDIGNISHETRNMFDGIKTDIGIKNNEHAMKIMMECCIRNPNDLRKIKEEIENKEKAENGMTIVKSV